MKEPVRIAMWSGPRNLSTAMMRSFGARSDTRCIDEPFYAAYLALTGLSHPMREEILRDHCSDPEAIARTLSEEPTGALIFYQKHMTHHMAAGIPRGWMARVRNAFLIRHPARVLASYARKMEQVSLDAIGFSQQADLFDHVVRQLGQAPVVIDGDDILRNPATALAALCAALGIAYDPAMLSWTAGRKPEDGAWAPHWYDAVWRSTGFGDAPGALPDLPETFSPILDDAMAIYERLAKHKVAVA